MTDITDIAQDRDDLVRSRTVAHAVVGIRIAQAMPGLCECERCGDPIGARRLKAQPSARRCFECQDALERQGGRS